MNKEERYYTINEFAKISGVTRQTLYNNLQSKLKDFYKEIDGKKMLSERAFSLFSVKDDVKFDNSLQSSFDNNFTSLYNDLTDLYKAELEEKNKEIERLRSVVDEKESLIKEKDKIITEIIKHQQEQEERITQLLYNSQVLLKEKEKKQNILKRLFAPKRKDYEE